jgi:hypothetical protein
VLIVILRGLTWTGLRRGVNGSRAWLTVGILAVGIRSLRRIARREPEVLYRTKVKPGDVLVLGARKPK